MQPDINGRLTWQATPKHKFGFYYDHQPRDVFGDRVERVARGDRTTSSSTKSQLIDRGLARRR